MAGEAYREFAFAGPKTPVKSPDIGAGQIKLSHLHPSLYLEIQKFWTHQHEGASSVKLTRNSFYTVPTRVINLDPPVTILQIDPGVGHTIPNWVDLDVSGQVSSRAIAVFGNVIIRATAANRVAYVRNNGDTTTGSVLWVANNPVANVYASGFFHTKIDTDKIFEWSVNSTDVDDLWFNLRGFVEEII